MRTDFNVLASFPRMHEPKSSPEAAKSKGEEVLPTNTGPGEAMGRETDEKLKAVSSATGSVGVSDRQLPERMGANVGIAGPPSLEPEGAVAIASATPAENQAMDEVAGRINASLQSGEWKARTAEMDMVNATASTATAGTSTERLEGAKRARSESSNTDKWSPSPDLANLRQRDERAILDPSKTASEINGPANRIHDSEAASVAIVQVSEQVRQTTASVLAQANVSPQIALGLLG